MRVVVSIVCAAWLLIGVVLGSQTALTLSMQGTPVVLTDALRTSLVNALPWILPTLAAIAMARRFPFTRDNWWRVLWLHLLAIPPLDWLANVGVVAGFWWMAGSFGGWSALASGAVYWATVRIHVAVLVYGATVALTHGWIYIRDARAKELHLARVEAQLQRARMQALNEQIRPHFLFNTLHTIGQMWRSGRADEADGMLDNLGSLFQRTRSSADRSAIPLSEELSMVDEYLAIEQARFSDRLEVWVRSTPEAADCMVPPLLLQPLVENAIRHGVSASPTAGRVTVDARVEGERLFVRIHDDGPGLNNGSSSSGGSGTGLANTRDRLLLAYGEDHRFEIEGSEGSGTLVTIELPTVRGPDAAVA